MRWLAAFAVMLLTGVMSGQQADAVGVRVFGHIVDKNGYAVPAAVVTLKVVDQLADLATVKTDAHGEFSFLRVSPGTYKLRVESPGFNKLDVQTSVPATEDQNLGILNMGINSLGDDSHMFEQPRVLVRTDSLQAPSICEVVKEPARFSNTRVTLRGPVQIDFENFELSASDCGGRLIDDIWLEYGSGPKRQPTIWCCGSMVPQDPVVLLQNDEFRKFDRLLTSHRKTEITATLTGRFDLVSAEHLPERKGRFCNGGFGHMGVFCGRLVIDSVSEVTARKPRR